MKTVHDLIKAKGHTVFFISPDVSIYTALTEMAEKNVGALVVMEEDRVAGIISERDYARKVILKGKSSRDTTVREIMTDRVFYVTPNRNMEECMALMIDKHVRHLPVMEEDRLVGIISIGDVVKAVIEDKKMIIQELEDYIIGRR
jgi:CBS domain-containing protein